TRALLHPYVVAGPRSDDTATTLLAGRFAELAVGKDQIVRASLGDSHELTVALHGPAHVATATGVEPELAIADGMVVVDARRAIHVRAGAFDIRAADARFATELHDGSAIVFVDRGEVVVDGAPVTAGHWVGVARSEALVAATRAHGHAIAPPDGADGVVA